MGTVPQKPPIEIDHFDPWYQACGKHFKSLFDRYGAPIIAFNLVKKNMTGEEDLGNEFEKAVAYLNQFLPAKKNIIWKWRLLPHNYKTQALGFLLHSYT